MLLISVTATCNDSLKVVFGVSRPPFIIEDRQTGISLELFRHIAEKMDIKFDPVFASNARMEIILQNMQKEDVDVVVEVQKTQPGLYYSKPFVAYRNFVITRENNPLQFKSYSDLKGERVSAWQNAKENLGQAFALQIPGFKEYREFPLQEKQVVSWLLGDFDVIIIDDTLFKWWAERLVRRFEKSGRNIDIGNLNYFPLPGNNELWWYVAFKDKTVRDRFDVVLERMKKNGEYKKIREGFIGKHN